MKILAYISIFSALLLSAWAEEPALSELKEARGKFMEQLAEIRAPYNNVVYDLRMKYIADLERARGVFQKQGELDKMQAVEGEKKRFVDHRSWGERLARRDRIDPVLHPVLNKYDKLEQQARSVYDQKRTALEQSYAKHLEKVKKSLTVQNRIDDALAIKNEIDQISKIETPTVRKPSLAQGKEPMKLDSPEALRDYLNLTRWEMQWISGRFSSPKFVEFHFGDVVAMTGSEKPWHIYKYEITDDLNVVVKNGYDHTLFFDPSMTIFNNSDPRRSPHSRGSLLLKREHKPVGEALDDLLLYYNFDTAGPMVKDGGPGGNDGTNEWATLAHWGARRNAFKFSGRRGGIFPTKPIAPDAYDGFSISVWIQVASDRVAGNVIGWEKKGEGSSLTISVNRGKAYVKTGGNHRQEFSSIPLKNDQWTHIVVAHRKNGSDCLYVNGKLQNAITSLNLKSSDSSFHIGGRMINQRYEYIYSGLIDELMVFKRTLSPDDARKLYLAVQ
ncbi:MAG: LamG domain-containing protein [Verrucomicrobiota bacterium]